MEPDVRGLTGVDLFGTTDAVVKHVLEVFLFTAIAGYGLFPTETVTMSFMCSFLQQRFIQSLLSIEHCFETLEVE